MPRNLRALLLEAVQGIDLADLDRLGPLATFEALAALWKSGWLGEGHRLQRVTAAEMRQRLRQVARARMSIAEASALAAGALVLVRGELRPATDGTLVIDDGERALVAEVRWIGSPARDGTVTALGFADPRFDPDALPAGPRRSPKRLWLASTHLPVVACRG
jgi:hypothetical protein